MDEIIAERIKMDNKWSLMFIALLILPSLLWVAISYGWLEVGAVMIADLVIYIGFKFWLYNKIAEKHPIPDSDKEQVEVHP